VHKNQAAFRQVKSKKESNQKNSFPSRIHNSRRPNMKSEGHAKTFFVIISLKPKYTKGST